jgi:nucleotide-binding universal stress UspA family protein
VEQKLLIPPAVRIVVAIEPHADPGWVTESIRILPLIDPLDVVLVSALDIPRPALTSPGPAARRLYGGAVAGLRRDAQEGAETVIEALRAALGPRANSMAVRIVDGRPVPTVLHAARAWNADLILVGSNGRGALGRAVLGSVSDEIVRAASCPVLVAKRRVARFERLLVATDGSVNAEAALRFVAALPVPPTAELRVCAVSEVSDALPGTDRDGRAALLLLLAETERRTAVQAVTKALDILTALSCPIQSSVRHGDAGRELADEVRRWLPDLLVIGARGRTAGNEVALGRVTESLLRQAACPTLVYRR